MMHLSKTIPIPTKLMGRPRHIFINKGDRFGRLQVIRQIRAPNGYTIFLCLCDCGKETTATPYQLKSKKKISCGCYHREVATANATKHGMSQSRVYSIWVGIKGRCLNNKNSSYKNYGDRGITICDEWMEFESFHKWAMETDYKDNLTIERTNNDGDYCPENCKWIPPNEQPKNRRGLNLIYFNGETKTLTELARKMGMRRRTLGIRLDRWPKDRAFNEPVNKKFGPKKCKSM